MGICVDLTQDTMKTTMGDRRSSNNGENREEGEIVDDFEDIISSDEELTMRKRIEELEARNSELEKLANISGYYDNYDVGIASDRYKPGKILKDKLHNGEYLIPTSSLYAKENLKRTTISSLKHNQRYAPHNDVLFPTSRKHDYIPPEPADYPVERHSFGSRKRKYEKSKRIRNMHKKNRSKSRKRARLDSDEEFCALDRSKLRRALRYEPASVQVDKKFPSAIKEGSGSVQRLPNGSNKVIELDDTPDKAEESDDAESLEIQELRLIALKSAFLRKDRQRKQRKEIEQKKPYSPTDCLHPIIPVDPEVASPQEFIENEPCNSMDISPISSPESVGDGCILKPVDMDLVDSSDSSSPEFLEPQSSWMPIHPVNDIPLPRSPQYYAAYHASPPDTSKHILSPIPIRASATTVSSSMRSIECITIETDDDEKVEIVSDGNASPEPEDEEVLALRALLIAQKNSPKFSKAVKTVNTSNVPNVEKDTSDQVDNAQPADPIKAILKITQGPPSKTQEILKEAVKRLQNKSNPNEELGGQDSAEAILPTEPQPLPPGNSLFPNDVDYRLLGSCNAIPIVEATVKPAEVVILKPQASPNVYQSVAPAKVAKVKENIYTSSEHRPNNIEIVPMKGMQRPIRKLPLSDITETGNVEAKMKPKFTEPSVQLQSNAATAVRGDINAPSAAPIAASLQKATNVHKAAVVESKVAAIDIIANQTTSANSEVKAGPAIVVSAGSTLISGGPALVVSAGPTLVVSAGPTLVADAVQLHVAEAVPPLVADAKSTNIDSNPQNEAPIASKPNLDEVKRQRKRSLTTLETLQMKTQSLIANGRFVSRNKVVAAKILNKAINHIASPTAKRKIMAKQKPPEDVRLVKNVILPSVKPLVINLGARSDSDSDDCYYADKEIKRQDVNSVDFDDVASPISLPMESPRDSPLTIPTVATPMLNVVAVNKANEVVKEEHVESRSVEAKSEGTFEAKLDEFLKEARFKVDMNKKDASRMNQPVKKAKVTGKDQKLAISSTAVRHLPPSAQLEYRRLINRMQMLEKQKLIKTDTGVAAKETTSKTSKNQVKVNNISSPVKATLKPTQPSVKTLATIETKTTVDSTAEDSFSLDTSSITRTIRNDSIVTSTPKTEVSELKKKEEISKDIKDTKDVVMADVGDGFDSKPEAKTAIDVGSDGSKKVNLCLEVGTIKAVHTINAEAASQAVVESKEAVTEKAVATKITSANKVKVIMPSATSTVVAVSKLAESSESAKEDKPAALVVSAPLSLTAVKSESVPSTSPTITCETTPSTLTAISSEAVPSILSSIASAFVPASTPSTKSIATPLPLSATISTSKPTSTPLGESSSSVPSKPQATLKSLVASTSVVASTTIFASKSLPMTKSNLLTRKQPAIKPKAKTIATKTATPKLKTPAKTATGKKIKATPTVSLIKPKVSQMKKSNPSNLPKLNDLQTCLDCERQYKESSSNLMENLWKTIQLVAAAQKEKNDKLILEQELVYLRKKILETEMRIKEKNASMALMFPKISSSHKLIVALKDRTTNLDQLSIDLSKRQGEKRNNSFYVEQKTKVKRLSKQLSMEIKKLKEMKVSIVENARIAGTSGGHQFMIDKGTQVVSTNQISPAKKSSKTSVVSQSSSSINSTVVSGNLTKNDSNSPSSKLISRRLSTSNNELSEKVQKPEGCELAECDNENVQSSLDSNNANVIGGEGDCNQGEVDRIGKSADGRPEKKLYYKIWDAVDMEGGGSGRKNIGHKNSYVSPLDFVSDCVGSVDPNGVLCPYQLMGQCDDKECKYEHLKV